MECANIHASQIVLSLQSNYFSKPDNMKITTMSLLGLAVISLTAGAAEPSSPCPADARFADFPVYDGEDLELLVNDRGTHFTLWSPEAEEVTLQIYDSDRNTAPVEIHRMARSNNGTWRFTSPDNLTGKFYTFRVKYNGE